MANAAALDCFQMNLHSASRTIVVSPTRPRHKRSTVKVAALVIFLALGANIFQFFPMLKSVREIWYVLSFLYCVLFAFFAQMLGRNGRLSGYEIYLFTVLAVMPFVSAISAKYAFGQPLIPGLLTHRGMATYGSGIALLYWLRTGLISLEDLRRAIVVVGWSSFVLYWAMSLLMEPANYEQSRGFVGGGFVEPYHFIFKSQFIVFLVIYYFVVGLLQKSLKPFLLTLPLLFYLVFLDGGRAQFLSLLIVLGLLFIRHLSLRRLLMLAIPFSFALAVAIALTYNYMPEEVERQVEKFNAAISVVVTGEESSDPSANARLRELELAMPYIKERLVFGNGQLSAQWRGGYFGNLGAFAPSDIGIWGLLFVFGLFGLAVFYGQYIFAWLTHRRQKRMIAHGLMSESAFRIAVTSYIVFLFIDSLATGRMVSAGSVSFLFIAILYGFNPGPRALTERRKELQRHNG